MRYEVHSGESRQRGAEGVFYPVTETIDAADAAAAEANFHRRRKDAGRAFKVTPADAPQLSEYALRASRETLNGPIVQRGADWIVSAGVFDVIFTVHGHAVAYVNRFWPTPERWGVRQCSAFLEDEGYTGDPPDANPFAIPEPDRSTMIRGMDAGHVPGLEDWRALCRIVLDATAEAA